MVMKRALLLVLLASVVFASVSITSDKDIYECGFRDGRWACDTVTMTITSDRLYKSVRLETPFEYKNAEISYWKVKDFRTNGIRVGKMVGRVFKAFKWKKTSNVELWKATITDFPLPPGTTVITLEPVAHGTFKWNASVVNNQNNQELAVLDPWFNTSWLYRIPFNVTSEYNLTDFQVYFTFDTASLINEGKMNSDCSDLRIANDAGDELPYFITSKCNTNNTLIYFKTNLTAGGSNTHYLYYGNPDAVDKSNGYDTFWYFNDFENTSNLNITSGTCSIVNDTILKCEGEAYWWDLTNITIENATFLRMYWTNFDGEASTDSDLYGFWIRRNHTAGTWQEDMGGYRLLTRHAQDFGLTKKYPGSQTDMCYYSGSWGSYTEKELDWIKQIAINSSVSNFSVKVFYWDTLTLEDPHVNCSDIDDGIGGLPPYTTGFLGGRTWGASSDEYSWTDWYAVAKAVENDPVVTFGSEEGFYVHINSPESGRVYLQNATLNFTVSEKGNYSIYVDGVLNKTVEISVDGGNYSEEMSFDEGNHSIHVEKSDNPAFNDTVEFNVSYFFIDNVSYDNPEYELSWSEIKYVIRHLENYSINNSYVTYHGEDYNSTLVEVNQTTCNATVTVPTPLANQTYNQTNVTFTIHAESNENKTTQLQKTQTVNKAFSIGDLQTEPTLLETADTTVNVTATRQGDAAITMIIQYNNTNQTATLLSQDESQYTYAANITIPLISQPEENKTVKAIMTLSFNGQTYEAYEEKEFNITIQQYTVFECNGSGTPLVKFLSYDEETADPITVDYFNLRLVTHVGSGGSKEQGFRKESTTSIEICVTPAADYYFNASLEYYKENYTKRYYEVVEKLAGATAGETAYPVFSLNESIAFLNTFYITDKYGQGIPGLLVHLERYYANESVYRIVESMITDDNGKVELILDRTQLYRIRLHNTTDVILKTYRPSIYKQDETLLTYVPPEDSFTSFISDVRSTCQYDNSSKIVICDYYSSTEKNVTLNVTEGIIGGEVICSNSKTIQGYDQITCDISQAQPRSTYIQAVQYIQYKGEWKLYKIDDFQFQKAAEWIGRDLMLVIAFMFVVTIGMAFSSNPMLMISATYIATLMLKLIGIIEASAVTIAGLGVAAAMLIWVTRR